MNHGGGIGGGMARCRNAARGSLTMAWRARAATIRTQAVALAVFATALALRVFRIQSRSIWMDEDAQARRVLAGGFDLALVKRAATQQQPPLDYYAERIGLDLFGITPLGARAHAALFGALAVLVLHVLLRRCFASRLVVWAGTLVALVHPMMLFYSQEARPIECGILFASVQLLALHGFLTGDKSKGMRTAWALFLLLGTTAFFLSVGFQPIVFVASTALVLVPALANRALRWRVVLAWCLSLAALALAWPVLKVVIQSGQLYVGRSPLYTHLGKVWTELAKLDVTAWSSKWALMLGPSWPLVGLGLVAALPQLLKELRGDGLCDTSRLTCFLLGMWLVFPGLFDTLFHTLIHYAIRDRYFATLAPVSVLLVAALADHLKRAATAFAMSPRRRWWAVALTLLASLTLVTQGRATLETYQTKRRDWQLTYEQFKQERTRGVAYLVHLVEPGERASGYYSQRFYYKFTEPRPVSLRLGKHLLSDYTRRHGFLDRGCIYLVVRKGWGQIRRLRHRIERDVPGAEVTIYSGNALIRLEAHRDGRGAVLRLLEVLVKHLKPKSSNTWVYETLARMYLDKGDWRQAQTLAKKLGTLRPHPPRRVISHLRRRIKNVRRGTKQHRAPQPRPGKSVRRRTQSAR